MYQDPVSKQQQKHSLIFIRVIFLLSDMWLSKITAIPGTSNGDRSQAKLAMKIKILPLTPRFSHRPETQDGL